MQFLYRDGDDYVFMDIESYDQQNVAPVALGDAADYMVENSVAIIAFYNGEIVTVEIPASVELAIAETEPGIQGDRVSGARKPATLETGKVVAGSTIREHRRSGQGRHPHRRLHHPGLSTMACRPRRRDLGPLRDNDERTDARERALLLLYEAESKASPLERCWPSRWSRSTPSPASGAGVEANRPHRRGDRRPQQGVDPRTDAGDRPQCAAHRHTNCSAEPTCRWP